MEQMGEVRVGPSFEMGRSKVAADFVAGEGGEEPSRVLSWQREHCSCAK